MLGTKSTNLYIFAVSIFHVKEIICNADIGNENYMVGWPHLHWEDLDK